MIIKIALNLVLSIFGLTFASGCGIKGDPLPPFEQQTVQATPEADVVVPKKGMKKAK